MKNIAFSSIFSILLTILLIVLAGCEAYTLSTTPTPTATINPTMEIIPSTTATATPTITSNPTATPTVVTPTPTPETTTYYNNEFKFQMDYPKDWIESSKDVFVGQNGYMIIKELENYNDPDFVHVTIDLANTQYAEYKPSVLCIGVGYGCAIMMEAPDLSGREIVKVISVMPYFHSHDSAKYFTLERPVEYAILLDKSMTLNTAVIEPTPDNEVIANPIPILLHDQGGLTIREIPLDEFSRVDDEYNSAQEIAYDHCGIDITQQNQDFRTSVENGRITVKQRDETVYEYASWVFNAPNPWTFCAWDNSWMLETNNFVIIDGQILNHQSGFTKVFSWHMLNNKQIYFAENNDGLKISIDGQLIPIIYDEIYHYGCCAAHGENPRTNGEKTWFKAKRDNTWFMVIISSN